MQTSGRQVTPSAPQQRSLISLVSPKDHPRRFFTLVLWLFGLYSVFLAAAPVKLTEERLAAYKERLKDAEQWSNQLDTAQDHLYTLERDMARFKVWFWRWRPEYKPQVLARLPAVNAAKDRVRELDRGLQKSLSVARGELGLWSTEGVDASRELLWTNFKEGKSVALRQTMFDAVWAGVRGSREDRDWMFTLIELLLITVFNYTIGTLISLFMFLISLPSFIAAWNPSWWSGLLFFVVAAISAVSVMLTYIGVLMGSGTVAVYATASVLQTRVLQRLEQQERQRAYVQDRSHID